MNWLSYLRDNVDCGLRIAEWDIIAKHLLITL